MKKNYLLILGIFFSKLIYAQNSTEPIAKKNNFSINSNMSNYDLQYCLIEMDVDPTQQFISGNITHYYKMMQSSDILYFDLAKNLNVSQVLYHGQSLTYQQLASDELKIYLPKTIMKGTMDSLSIKYSGIPSKENKAFVTSIENGMPVLATVSQPFAAREWWPTKQSLNDKIEKLDIKIITPPQYSVGSNGKLISETILSTGKKQTFWQTNYPTAAYMFGIGVTKYVKNSGWLGNLGNQFPFLNYIFPSSAADTTVLSNIDWTKQCMETFENYFGEYPYRNEKYGHMQIGPGVSMEHSTMSSMSNFNKEQIAHELAHQWFGNKVTCGAWNDIWLNEGFATFAQFLANEKHLMTPDEFRSYLKASAARITAEPDGSIYIPANTELDISRIYYKRLSFGKAGYALWMIKWILGEEKFYEMLKAYHNNPAFAYGYVTTEDFKSFLNSYTGKDFTEFFNDWIYNQGHPTYHIKWTQYNNRIVFNVLQTQSHSSVSFFEMPLPIKVIGTKGEAAYFLLNNTFSNQFFTESIPFQVERVYFNYENQILEKNSTVTTDKL